MKKLTQLTKKKKEEEGRRRRRKKKKKEEEEGGRRRRKKEEEEEEWIEYMKRSTEVAIDRMKTAQIQCWIKTHRRMKWRLAMRIASLPEVIWIRKAAEWNPNFSTKYKTHKAVGRPKKRWEDEINDFLRLERTADETSNVERNKKMSGSRQRKIRKVGRKWKTSSQWRQQQLRHRAPAQKENDRQCMTPAADTTLSGPKPSIVSNTVTGILTRSMGRT